MELFRSIFGSVVGGGLAIFTDNPFQRKKERGGTAEMAASVCGENRDACAQGDKELVEMSREKKTKRAIAAAGVCDGWKSYEVDAATFGQERPLENGWVDGRRRRRKGETAGDDVSDGQCRGRVEKIEAAATLLGENLEAHVEGERNLVGTMRQKKIKRGAAETGVRNGKRSHEADVTTSELENEWLEARKRRGKRQKEAHDVSDEQCHDRVERHEKIRVTGNIGNNFDRPRKTDRTSDLDDRHAKKRKINERSETEKEGLEDHLLLHLEKRKEHKQSVHFSDVTASTSKSVDQGKQVIIENTEARNTSSPVRKGKVRDHNVQIDLNGNSHELHEVKNSRRVEQRELGHSEYIRSHNKSVKSKRMPTGVSREGATMSGSKRKREDDIEERFEKKQRVLHEGAITNWATAEIPNETNEVHYASSIPGLQDMACRKRKQKEEENEFRKNRKTFDNDEKLKRTIFVGNLPVQTRSKDVMKEFSQFGAVESVRLRSVPLLETKLPRKGAIIKGQINEGMSSLHAYVVFQEEDSAKAALALNMKEFRGNHIRVDAAYAPRKVTKDMSLTYDRSRSIFLGNVPFDVKDEELYNMFGMGKNPAMEVEAVRVVRDPQTSLCKGIAFVLFKDKASVKYVLSKGSMKLRDRKLRISRVLHVQPQHSINVKVTKRRRESEASGNGEKKRSKIQPYEGFRATKADGRPGKSTASEVLSSSYGGRRPGKGTIGIPLPKKRQAAVAARKTDIKSGGLPKFSGEKRKRTEKRQRGSSRAKKVRRA
eukprot:c28098_g1_i1 orf=273-2582(+)